MADAAEEISTQEGPASLREALMESFDEAESTEPESTDSEPTEEADIPTSEILEAEAESSDETEVEEPDESQDEVEVIQAPEHWSADDRALFETLNPETQQYLLRRDKEYAQGIEEKSKRLKQFEDALKPYESMLQMRGMDHATAVQYWANAQAQLDANPKQALEMLARSYGIELSGQDTGDNDVSRETNDDSYTDPEIRKLRSELNGLKQQNQNLSSHLQMTAQQEAYQQVQQFMQETDDSGNLLHPHFESVKNQMHGLIQSGMADNLQDAYDQAIWLVPEYREEELARQRKQAEADLRKQREQAALKAKKVAKGVQGKKSQPAPKTNKTGTMRDTLAETWDELAQG